MSKTSNVITTMLAILAVGTLMGCNSSTSAVEGKKSAQKTATETTDAETKDGEASLAAENPEENGNQLEVAKVINDPGSVTNRGGYIKILVNKEPITNFDIKRRVAFLKLRRARGNLNQLAEKEMIEQALRLQEAKRTRSLATDEQVETAFSNFAKANRASRSQMTSELNRRGVTAKHFKEFIRSQISWQRLVQGRFQSETNQKSERDVITQLRKSGDAKPEVTEYNLQQVIFVVPESRRSAGLLKARKAEAAAFRQQVSGCTDNIGKIKNLRDVSLVDRKRIMEPELPENWKTEITSIDINTATRPKETNRGIELMIVCNKRVVNDDRAAKVTSQATDFDSFNEKGTELSQTYLAEVKSRATIVYR